MRTTTRALTGLTAATVLPLSACASLIGRSRAAILEHLVVPRSTTWLARSLHLAPATVSAHLAVMSASGLLDSRRAGREVLYVRTPVAEQLLHHQVRRML